MSRAEELRQEMARLQEELEQEENRERKKVVPIRNDQKEPEVVDVEILEEEETLEETDTVEEEPSEEVQEANQTEDQGERVVTLIQVGYTQSGRPFFNVDGEVNLFALEGLIRYAQRQLDKEWELREIAAEEARQAAQEELRRKQQEARKAATQKASKRRR